MIRFFFGERPVGEVDALADPPAADGIGVRFLEHGITALGEGRRYTVADGAAFEEALVRELSDPLGANRLYFRAEYAPAAEPRPLVPDA